MVLEDNPSICLMCFKEYKYIEDALKCEAKHKKNEDDYWMKSEEKLSRDRLQRAGENPNQRHL